jgi:hypothetical protein
VAGHEVVDNGPGNRTAPSPPAAVPVRAQPPRATPAPGHPAAPGSRVKYAPGSAGRGRKVRRRGQGTPGELARGHTRARTPKAKAKANSGAGAQGAPRGRRPAVPPGKTRPRSTPPAGRPDLPAARPPGAEKLK